MSDDIGKAFEKSFKLSAQKCAELDAEVARVIAKDQSLIEQHVPRFESLIAGISENFPVSKVKFDDCARFEVEVADDYKLEAGFFIVRGLSKRAEDIQGLLLA